MPKYYSSAKRHGEYASGLEFNIANQLTGRGVSFEYEQARLFYVQPAKVCSYKPDFILPNGIIIEGKGRFLTDDRQGHKHIKAMHPNLDIRFVFSRSAAPINKGSPTSYGMWCERYGFQYADKLIPASWMAEKKCQVRLDAIEIAKDKEYSIARLPVMSEPED